MANYSAIKAAVNAYIKANGRKEITGSILNAVLNATIDSLGRYFQFAGGAMPTDDPGTPDQNVCYLATEPGLYIHFNNIRIENEEVALLFWDGSWRKNSVLMGIREVAANVDNNVGTPSVDVSYSQGRLVLSFHNLKGRQGETGDPAGFGTIGADITGGVGTPGVSVESSGDNAAKNLMFHFTNLKGETGVTSVVATIDNTTGTPSCQVSLVNGVMTLAFSGLKGLKGDTGVSADYPITIYNGLDSDATDQALAAAQGKVLDERLSQVETEVSELTETQIIDVTGTGTFNTGRILPQGAIPSYTNYRYQLFNAIAGDIVHYKAMADAATIILGKRVTGGYEAIVQGGGNVNYVEGDYLIPEDGTYSVCGYSNMITTARITRDGEIPRIEEHLEAVEQLVMEKKVDLLSGVTMDTGRLLATTGQIVINSTYKYKTFDAHRGDVFQYKSTADTNTIVFGYIKDGDPRYTGVSVGIGGDPVTGIFTAPDKCTIIICSYTNTTPSLEKLIPNIEERVENLESLSDEVSMLEKYVGSETATEESLTIVTGQYVDYAGVVRSLSGSRMSAPISLNSGDIIRIKGQANSAIAILSKTDALGSYYMPLKLGTGPSSGTEQFSVDYRITEDGYYVVCSMYDSPTLEQLIYTGLIAEVQELQENISVGENEGINLLAAFSNLVCVGDSLTWSSVYYGSGTYDVRQARRTYPEILSSLCGNDYQLLATGGDTAKRCWDTQKNNIVAKDNPLAIIYLGTNYGITDTLETDVVGDDPDGWADNNVGCYCRFVQKFQSLGYKVLLLKIWATSGSGDSDLAHTNSAITHIGERFGCAVMDAPVSQEYKYHWFPDMSGRNVVHYNDMGYAWFASALIKSVAELPQGQVGLLIPE